MSDKQSYRALIVATIVFAGNFSVWTLYSVMGIQLRETLLLSSTELGLLFAAPMLTGAILRLPVGLLTERYDCKTLFIWQMVLVIPPLLALYYVETFWGYLVAGLLIGVSGVSFTIGIRYVTDWFPKHEQGSAMGIFGAGNSGAAISLVAIPFIVSFAGWKYVGPIYAVGTVVMIIVFWLMAPKSPKYISNATKPSWAEITAPIFDLKVARFGLYYYFVFGSFLALILWLPQYYVNAYGLSVSQAMALTLFFVTTSSLARAVGGWFADRYGASSVNWSVFWICLVCLFFLSYPPTSMTVFGVDRDVEFRIEINLWVFTGLLFIIGLAQGFGRASVYKAIYDAYPKRMGSVGGVVATIGALGGFTLPILFGIAVDILGVYSACFMLLYGVLAACMLAMYFADKAERYQNRLKEASESNFLSD